MPHPLVDQLRFTRSEFKRALKGLTNEEAARRFMPMNCIAWNVGHLAWHEQRYFITFGLGEVPFPDLNKLFAYGAPACTPNLDEMLSVWKKMTKAADPFLDTLYHYWYHTGENSAIRQNLGHTDLPQFVGNIDSKAPYRPE